MSQTTTASNAAALPPVDPHTTVRLMACEDHLATVAIDHSNYRLHLKCEGACPDKTGGRIQGIIEVSVWKVDRVSAGGSFIEPVVGRPRRVQGPVVGRGEGNAIVVSIVGTHILAVLSERYDAATFRLGEKVGLDVFEGASLRDVQAK